MKRVLLGEDLIHMAVRSEEELGTFEYMVEWMRRINEQPCIDMPMKFHLDSKALAYPPVIRKIPVIAATARKSRELLALSKLLGSPFPNDTFWTFSSRRHALFQMSLVQGGKVDLYITDDRLIHDIAKEINLDDRIYSTESYLDRCASEFRSKDPSKDLVVKKGKFGALNFSDPFFSTFKRDYPLYDKWVVRKKDDSVYYSEDRRGNIQALLKLKVEENPEEFLDITPIFPDNSTLKISSFKVNVRGSKLSERFMRLIFKKAIKEKVDSIYVTLFNNANPKERLVSMLKKWGFEIWGNKTGTEELVMRRDFRKIPFYGNFNEVDFFNHNHVKEWFPYHSPSVGVYLVPLQSDYIDLLLGKEDEQDNPDDIVPFRNAISKVIVMRNLSVSIGPGATLLFYRMTHAKHKRGIVGVGIVERVKSDFESERQFIGICRKRTSFSDSHLRECWKNICERDKVSIIEFLFVDYLNSREYSEKRLSECGVDTSNLHSQRIVPLSRRSFDLLFKDSEYERDYIAY